METSLVCCLGHRYSCYALVAIHGNKHVIFPGVPLYYGNNSIVTSGPSLLSGGSRGGSGVSMEPPFLPSSLVEVYVLRENLVLMEPPYSMNSISTLTEAQLLVFLE